MPTSLVQNTPPQSASSANSVITLALVGAPNCGKTALFNLLTGSNAKVANYSGVTVDKRSASFSGDTRVRILDLPGTYSLATTSPDEEVTRRVLYGEMPNEAIPDAIIVVADATNLRLSLRMILELKSLGLPMMVALNLHDVAASRGLVVDEKQLSDALGMPVVKTVAIKRGANQPLMALINEFAEQHQPYARPIRFRQPMAEAQRLYQQADDIIQHTVTTAPSLPNWHQRLDYWALHPIVGVALLFVILFVIFQAVYAWAAPMMDGLQGLVDAFGAMLAGWLPEGILKSLLVDGIVAGVGSVVVFVPQIALLFLFLLLLEDSGYLPRAAFLLDNVLAKVGLSGRSFIPLLSGFACAVPAIMSTRTIPNPRERFIAIAVLPILTCSARLPIYALIIAAVIPKKTILGLFNLQGLTLFILYTAGIVSAALVSWLLTRFAKGDANKISFPLLMELPTYRMPNIKHIATELWSKVRAFLMQAGTVIFSLSVLLWALVSFPKPPLGAVGPAIDYSLAGMLGHIIEPLFAPIGFSWQMCIALIPGLAAREVVVAALGTVYAVGNVGDEMVHHTLVPIIRAQWGLATAFAFLAFYIYAPMCLATLAVIRRETKSLPQTLAITAYLFVLAYVTAWLTYKIVGTLYGYGG